MCHYQADAVCLQSFDVNAIHHVTVLTDCVVLMYFYLQYLVYLVDKGHILVSMLSDKPRKMNDQGQINHVSLILCLVYSGAIFIIYHIHHYSSKCYSQKMHRSSHIQTIPKWWLSGVIFIQATLRMDAFCPQLSCMIGVDLSYILYPVRMLYTKIRWKEYEWSFDFPVRLLAGYMWASKSAIMLISLMCSYLK